MPRTEWPSRRGLRRGSEAVSAQPPIVRAAPERGGGAAFREATCHPRLPVRRGPAGVEARACTRPRARTGAPVRAPPRPPLLSNAAPTLRPTAGSQPPAPRPRTAGVASAGAQRGRTAPGCCPGPRPRTVIRAEPRLSGPGRRRPAAAPASLFPLPGADRPPPARPERRSSHRCGPADRRPLPARPSAPGAGPRAHEVRGRRAPSSAPRERPRETARGAASGAQATGPRQVGLRANPSVYLRFPGGATSRGDARCAALFPAGCERRSCRGRPCALGRGRRRSNSPGRPAAGGGRRPGRTRSPPAAPSCVRAPRRVTDSPASAPRSADPCAVRPTTAPSLCPSTARPK